MLQAQEPETNATWTEDSEHLLPIITSLIFEGLQAKSKDRDMDFKLFRDRKKSNWKKFVHCFSAPSADSLKKEISIAKISSETYGGRPVCVTHHHERMQLVRSFVSGLSHNYNNLLMGIWGHASLVGMVLEKDHPSQSELQQIENMIQNGSNLFHLFFGCIVERRSAARRLRLSQMVEEIRAYNQLSGNDIDFDLIENCIHEMSKGDNKTQLASCMAQIMDRMLSMIQNRCQQIRTDVCPDSPKAAAHLEKIDALLDRGFQIIMGLNYYAEASPPTKQRGDLISLVRQQAGQAAARYPHIAVTRDFSPTVPTLDIDPHQIRYALDGLIDNAVDATAEGGTVHIQVDTLASEKPQERFGMHTFSDYAVITLSDNGEGMTTETQAKIFDPFFTTRKTPYRTGLGLAAAAGIIKCHGGYIQVRSRPGRGSSVKFYLPNG